MKVEEGTVTIREITATTPRLMMPRIHRYIIVRHHSGPYLDTSLFCNIEEFTLDYNVQHILLIEVSPPPSFYTVFSAIIGSLCFREQRSIRASLRSTMPC